MTARWDIELIEGGHSAGLLVIEPEEAGEVAVLVEWLRHDKRVDASIGRLEDGRVFRITLRAVPTGDWSSPAEFGF